MPARTFLTGKRQRRLLPIDAAQQTSPQDSKLPQQQDVHLPRLAPLSGINGDHRGQAQPVSQEVADTKGSVGRSIAGDKRVGLIDAHARGNGPTTMVSLLCLRLRALPEGGGRSSLNSRRDAASAESPGAGRDSRPRPSSRQAME